MDHDAVDQQYAQHKNYCKLSHNYYGRSVYASTPAVLGPPVELILTCDEEDIYTIGLGKVITNT